MKSASGMKRAVVIFLDEVSKAERMVENDVVLRDTPSCWRIPQEQSSFLRHHHFFNNNDLRKALFRYRHIVSPMKMVLLDCRSPKLKHVVCHRRQLCMIPKDDNSHMLMLNFRIKGLNYVFLTLQTT